MEFTDNPPMMMTSIPDIGPHIGLNQAKDVGMSDYMHTNHICCKYHSENVSVTCLVTNDYSGVSIVTLCQMPYKEAMKIIDNSNMIVGSNKEKNKYGLL